MMDFRGRRIGPVMNGIASVQSGIIHSIHFNRFGDNPLSITNSLFQHSNYGIGNYLKKRLDALVLLDRGYNYDGVQKYLTNLGISILGTHSEKFNNWPFVSSEKKR